MDVDDIRRKRMRLFTPAAAVPEQEALTDLTDGDFINEDERLAKQLQSEYDAGWDKAIPAAGACPYAPPPQQVQHQPAFTTPPSLPFQSNIAPPPPPPPPPPYLSFDSGYHYPQTYPQAYPQPKMSSDSELVADAAEPHYNFGKRSKRSSEAPETPSTPATIPSLAHDADVSNEANAIRTLAADVLNIACGSCGSREISATIDIDRLARDLQTQIGNVSNRKATEISAFRSILNADNRSVRVRAPFGCLACDSRANCLGCGQPYGLAQLSIMTVDGLSIVWHCDRERTILVWLLLCGYDAVVKHNKPQAPKPTSGRKGGRRGRSSGVGYGGDDGDGFGFGDEDEQYIEDSDGEDFGPFPPQMQQKTMLEKMNKIKAQMAKSKQEPKNKPKQKFATLSSLHGSTKPKGKKSIPFGGAGHTLSGPTGSPPLQPLYGNIGGAPLTDYMWAHPDEHTHSKTANAPPQPGISLGNTASSPPPPRSFNPTAPPSNPAVPPGFGGYPSMASYAAPNHYPPPHFYNSAFSGPGQTLSAQPVAGPEAISPEFLPDISAVAHESAEVTGEGEPNNSNDIPSFLELSLGDEAEHPEAYAMYLAQRHGRKRRSLSPPRDDPDDAHTARVMAMLNELLPSQGNEIITSVLLRSSILDRAAELLRNESLEDVTRRSGLYESLFGFMKTLTTCYPTTVEGGRLINQAGHDLLRVSMGQATRMKAEKMEMSQPLSACMAGLQTQSKLMIQSAERNSQAFETEEMQNTLWLCRTAVELADVLAAGRKADTTRQSGDVALRAEGTASVSNELPAPVYKDAWQKDMSVLFIPDDVMLANNYYAVEARSMSGAATGRMAKLMKEIMSLTTGLPPGIFVRYGESRMDVMKVLIVGPQGTPYENGLWEFDVLCPSDYPNASPKMSFRTTGGGVARVNPNLYNDGKVCLSLLGTWSGEPWRPGKSTLLQVFISIQAMIFCEEPHCNEPSFEQDRGSEQSKAYSRRVYAMTVKHAMLEWLGIGRPTAAIGRSRRSGGKTLADASNDRTPANVPATKNEVWEEIAEKHFAVNKDGILQTVDRWVKDKPPAHPVRKTRSTSETEWSSGIGASMTTMAAGPYVGIHPYPPSHPQPHPPGFVGTGWAGKTLGGGSTPMFSHTFAPMPSYDLTTQPQPWPAMSTPSVPPTFTPYGLAAVSMPLHAPQYKYLTQSPPPHEEVVQQQQNLQALPAASRSVSNDTADAVPTTATMTGGTGGFVEQLKGALTELERNAPDSYFGH